VSGKVPAMVRTRQDADGRVGAEGRADRRDPRSIKDRGPPADQAISSRGSTARGPAVSELVGEIALVLLFIVIGGTFNAAEISMISLRESQVVRLAATRGRRGQRLEALVSDPNRFLAAVQIGVTVATMLSSALGAATVSERVSGWLIEQGMRPSAAAPVALVGVTLIISFFSLVLGELAPKRLGLQRSESIALVAAAPLSVLARLFRPVVWLLGRCSDLVVRLLGGDPRSHREVIGPEELRSLVLAHESLSSVERRMIVDVFDAETTRVREVMVPRPEVVFLPASMTISRAARLALTHPHSRFPVTGHDADDVVGVVHMRDLMVPSHALGRAACVSDISTPVTVLPGTKMVLNALHDMRVAGQHLAVIVDEYGGTDGIVTLEDLVSEIVGEMTGGPTRPAGTLTNGQVIQVDGRLNLDDFAEATGIELPAGPYDTAAGYLMAGLGRLAEAGDSIVWMDRRLTVTAMDGRRIARIDISTVAR
jgi:putative hemolysin